MSGRAALEVVIPGSTVSVQDLPGRVGHRHEGFPPSGPMDPFAFRVANLLVGNPDTAAGVEIPKSRFRVATLVPVTIAVTGPPELTVTVDDEPAPTWRSLPVDAGREIQVNLTGGTGCHTYLAVRGGVLVPMVLGSRATSVVVGFGGMRGRVLSAGDTLMIPDSPGDGGDLWLPPAARPRFTRDWEIEVITSADLEDHPVLAGRWRVDLASDRGGAVLTGTDPPESSVDPDRRAGALDRPYLPGTVLLVGRHPVLLGPDGPVTSGFGTIATVPTGARWKLGQLRPGRDHVRLRPVTQAEATRLRTDLRHRLSHIEPTPTPA